MEIVGYSPNKKIRNDRAYLSDLTWVQAKADAFPDALENIKIHNCKLYHFEDCSASMPDFLAINCNK